MFWKSVPKEDWPSDEESLTSIQKQWEEPFGDMRQELVFIGQELDRKAIVNTLNKSLLSDNELQKGEEYWVTLTDPFPEWKEIT